MALLNVLTGLATLVGSLRGNKSKATAASNTDSVGFTDGKTTENVNQTTNEVASSNGTTSSTSADRGSSTSQTTGSTVGNESSSTQTRTVGSESSRGVTTNLGFNSEIMSKLNTLLGGAVSDGSRGIASKGLTDRMLQLNAQSRQPGFNAGAFAGAVSRQANNKTQDVLEGSLNGLIGQTGGTEKGNSMAALLGNRLRNDAATEMVGNTAAARAQGEEIARANQQSLTGQMSQIGGDIMGSLTNLIQSLNGAQGTQVTNQQATNTQSGVQLGNVGSTNTTSNTAVGTTSATSTVNGTQSTDSKSVQGVNSSSVGTQDVKSGSTENVNSTASDGKSLFDKFMEMTTGAVAKA